jgi:hypothetical protein
LILAGMLTKLGFVPTLPTISERGSDSQDFAPLLINPPPTVT